MPTRLAINGFGRVGRLVLRAIHESGRQDIEIVAINDLGSVEANAHLLRHDSVHGRFPGKVDASSDAIDIGRGPIRVFAQSSPAELPWRDLNIDIVLECTGRFRTRELAAEHLSAGAKRVLVSAPCKNADITVVFGVNHEKLDASHTIVSNASCTTNCLAPVAHVLNTAFGIEEGFMTTVHAYTGDQHLIDALHKDLHRARAGAMSMIPTSTGAARAVGLVLPELDGKLVGTAVRVPTPNVSMVDLCFVPSRDTTVEDINAAMTKAANGTLRGVLDTVSEPLVSIDFNHDPASAIFDLTETRIVRRRLARVLSWYDNEWGFSHRMCDVAAAMGGFG